MKCLLAIFPLILTATALNEAILAEFKTGNHLLSSDIYKYLSEQSGNFLLSPLSLETILALTLSGARGKTAEELQSGLRFPKNGTEEIVTSLLPKLKSDNYILASPNKIYVQNGFEILDEFRKIALEKYGAGVENIDFDKKAETVKIINEWVEEQTRQKIHDIISPKDISENTSLILINALYFKGNWSTPFLAESTSSKKFYLKENEEVTVDTLHDTNFYNYYECSQVDAKFVEIPYKGGDASLVIVLPNEKTGISNLESKIDKVFTPRNFTREPVNVALPKFKVESTIDVQKILKQLGITAPFDHKEADFTGIGGRKGELIISSILQKTFIEVNEEGAEAAASTIVQGEFIATSSLVVEAETKSFIADHPFIFYIKVKDVVLFGGRVANPAL